MAILKEDIRSSGYREEGYQVNRISGNYDPLISWYSDIHSLIICCPDNLVNKSGVGKWIS